MKNIVFIIIGIFFGIVMVKSEAASWFRIQEMFRFQSFHMYGIIGSAVVVGAISLQLIKRLKVKDLYGQVIEGSPKTMLVKATLIGGFIFGLGWAFTGACPGPLFVNFGAGYSVMIVPIAAAIFGSFVYGMTKKYLPH